MDGAAFKTYTAETLTPTLTPGAILVMDNLPADKAANIAENIAKQMAQPFYLAPYSPDMKPIEKAFSKLKTALRAKPAAPSTHSGDASGSSSIALRRKTAPTISKRRDINTQCENALEEPGKSDRGLEQG